MARAPAADPLAVTPLRAVLDVVEGTHFAALTFSPTSPATLRPIAGHHFQVDVTGEMPGTRTVQVSYGHDALADEISFPVVGVTAQGAP